MPTYKVTAKTLIKTLDHINELTALVAQYLGEVDGDMEFTLVAKGVTPSGGNQGHLPPKCPDPDNPRDPHGHVKGGKGLELKAGTATAPRKRARK